MERTSDASSVGGRLRRHKVTAPAWHDYTNKSLFVFRRGSGELAVSTGTWGRDGWWMRSQGVGHKAIAGINNRSVKEASSEPCVWLKSQWMEVEVVCVMGGLLGSALLKWCQMDYLQKCLCCAHFQFIISKWGCRPGEDEWRTMCPHVQAVFKGPTV